MATKQDRVQHKITSKSVSAPAPVTEEPRATSFDRQTELAGVMRRAAASPSLLSPVDGKLLQRTIGNRATGALLGKVVSAEARQAAAQQSFAALVQRIHNPMMLQRKPDDPDVTTIDWPSATAATPSPPSAMGGVVFVVVGGVTHVVKPSDQPAAALFGEKMLEDVAGVETTQSKPVAADSAEGGRILHMLAAKKAEADGGENEELKASWADRYAQAGRATYFMIQKAMIPANQFSKLVRNDPLRILNNRAVLEGIGRTMAVDGLAGNQDRFENLNFDNVFLTAENAIAAIDTDAVLQNYAKSKSESDTNEIWPLAGTIHGTGDWAEGLTSGGVSIYPEGATMGPSSSDLRVLFERFDGWFDGFQNKFVKERAELEGSVDWAVVKAGIRAGIDAGVAAITGMLSGEGYGAMHRHFSAVEDRYDDGGVDPNLDWRAFQVKAAYLQTRAGGGGPRDKARLEAAFVAKQPDEWAREVEALGNADARVGPIPPPPGKLSTKKKSTRAQFDAVYAAALAAVAEHVVSLETLLARTRQLYAGRRAGGLAADVARRMLPPIGALVESKRLYTVVLIGYRQAREGIRAWDARDDGAREAEIAARIDRLLAATTALSGLVRDEKAAARAAIVTRPRARHAPAAPPPMAPMERRRSIGELPEGGFED